MPTATKKAPRQVSYPDFVTKRDGRKVHFDKTKIKQAVYRCLTLGVKRPESEATRVAQDVAEAVALILTRNGEEVTVEHVQRLVIQQLWALGHFEAAEHYTIYREERRKIREARPVPQEVADRVANDQAHFPNDFQYYQFIGKFSRWRDQDRRRETWRETCDRFMGWFKNLPLVKGRLTEQEWQELDQAAYGLEVSPAMRVVQMAGPALERCEVGVYNCAYHPIEDLFGLPEMLYILMQGTGSGFSVESDYIDELPRIKRQKGNKPDTIVVPDTTEGWCDAYYQGLQRWVDGHDVVYDASNVRPKNSRLKVKGGRASGPEPFLELTSFARNVFLGRQGRCLEDTDVHRLACFTGRIVQVGGVRRASEISLSDLLSYGMRGLKSGPWWADPTYWPDGKYLSMANNSAVYNERPSAEVFMGEWLALVKSKAGERGIFNREAAVKWKPHRRKKARFGCNPCAEIILRPYEFCNLTIAVARPDDTAETLKRKVRLAAVFGVMQSTCTRFNYIREDWKKNCEEERLLGVDITGHADCPLLQCGAPGRAELLELLKKEVAKVRKEFAKRFGINESAADTCIKPGGDSSIFFDCGSGISDRYADWQIRWFREQKDSPVAKFLIDANVPHAPAPESPESLLVFGFPRHSPPGSTTRNQHTAVQQCEMWLETKKHWAEHSVSATIYVDEHEWPEVGAWVYKQEHWDHITGLSFLPKDNGTYTYAPNEELTKEQYDEFKANFPKLNWAKLQQYETEDSTNFIAEPACAGGACEL